MQLFAFDKKHNLVFIDNAQKGTSYYCPECTMEIRAKFGNVRAPHFFHLTNSSCKHSKKSIEHIKVQQRIIEELGLNISNMEVYFPKIQRIGDVVFPLKKIVFEIQCSFIEPKEILRRIKDYKEAGYDVVWILHEKYFTRSSYCKDILRTHTHYYTNINSDGLGSFYDQIDSKIKFPIQLSTIKTCPKIDHLHAIQKHLHLRLQCWKFYAKGDVIDNYLFEKHDFSKISLHEAPCKTKRNSYFQSIKFFFRSMLYKISRS